MYGCCVDSLWGFLLGFGMEHFVSDEFREDRVKKETMVFNIGPPRCA